MAHVPDQLGCMLGALLNLYVGDRLGRIKTLYVYVTHSATYHANLQRRYRDHYRDYPSSCIRHLRHDDLCPNLQRCL